MSVPSTANPLVWLVDELDCVFELSLALTILIVPFWPFACSVFNDSPVLLVLPSITSAVASPVNLGTPGLGSIPAASYIPSGIGF